MAEDNQKAIFDPNLYKFVDLVNTSSFMDHSLLITLFLQRGQKLFISAPEHSCKSSNMDLVRQFFEIEKDGTVEDDLKDRTHFSLFNSLEIMHIPERKSLQEHFRAHPVIFVDFKGFVVSDCNNVMRDVLDHCYHKLKVVFEEHKEYLEDKLAPSYDKKLCEIWWRSEKCEDVGARNVKNALSTLCDCLYKAYKKSVMVLIDNCDAVATGVLQHKMSRSVANSAVNLFEMVLGGATRGSDVDKQIQGVLLTGVYHICGDSVLKPVKITRYRFLDDMSVSGDLIVKVYGLCDTQLDQLLLRLSRQKRLTSTINDVKKTIELHHQGYYTKKGNCVYSLWSVLRHLQASAVDAKTPPLTGLYKRTCLDRSIAADILKLIGQGQICIKYESKILISSLLSDRELDRDVFFTLLLDSGFLTNVKVEAASFGEIVGVRVPNHQVKTLLQELLHVTIGGFKSDLMNKTAKIIQKVCAHSATDDEKYRKHLRSLYKTLLVLFGGFRSSSYDLGDYALYGLISIIMSYTDLVEVVTKNRRSCDLWLVDPETNFALIWAITFNRNSKGDLCENKTSLCALKELLHHVEEVSGRYLLVGLTMDEACRPSLSLQTCDNNQAVCVSETEPAAFPNLYKHCCNLLQNKEK